MFFLETFDRMKSWQMICFKHLIIRSNNYLFVDSLINRSSVHIWNAGRKKLRGRSWCVIAFQFLSSDRKPLNTMFFFWYGNRFSFAKCTLYAQYISTNCASLRKPGDSRWLPTTFGRAGRDRSTMGTPVVHAFCRS